MGILSSFRSKLSSLQFPEEPTYTPRPDFVITPKMQAEHAAFQQTMRDFADSREQHSQSELDARRAQFKMPRTIEDVRNW